MLLQMGVLAPHHARDDVAHAVVVADLLVLVPRGVLASLRRPFAGAVGILKGVGQKAAAGRAGDDLVAVVGDGSVVAKTAALAPVHRGAHGLSGVLDEQRAVGLADALDLVHLGGEAVEVGHDHQLHFGIEGERLFQSHRVHVPAAGLGVDKDGDTALVDHGVQRSIKGHVRAEHTPPRKSAVADGGLSIEPLPCQLHAQVQRGSAAGEADRITDLRLFSGDALDLVDILAYGAHPVCFIRLGHVAQLLAVHGGRGEPDLLFKGGKAVVCGKSHHSTSLSCFAGGSFVCAAAKFCAVPVLSRHRIRPPRAGREPLPCHPAQR